jgi:sugar lactone lactonase YvrE
MNNASRIVTVGLLIVAAAVVAPVVAIDRWEASTARDFLLGTFDGTAIDGRGRIGLAPQVTHLWGPEPGIVWDLVASRGGTVFVALSGPGQVVAIDADGDSTVWLETDADSLVTSLAPDGKGGVYAGLSPEGRLLHLSGPGESATLAESGASFIWAMESDGHGGLWLGTGVPGKILRFTEGDGIETIYETGDDPVRSLTATDDGVIAGTGGRGRVIEISRDGDPFVLFDADQTEIVALARDDDGAVFALAAGGPQQPSATAQAAARAADAYVRVTAEAPPADGGKGNGNSNGSSKGEQKKDAKTSQARPPQRPSYSGGTLYRIDAEGTQEIWQARNEVPFDLRRSPDGLLFVATGDRGRVWRLSPDGETAQAFPIASNQASALAGDDKGRLWVGGTSDARVERLDTQFRDSGDYLSLPVDAGSHSDWGRIVWDADVPRGAGLEIHVRSGNTTEPDETWSDWVALGENGQIDVGRVPRSRLLQVKLSLTGSGDSGPRVSALRVSYEPRNRAPEIGALSVEAPGVVIVAAPKPANGNLGPLVASDPVTRDAVGRATRGRQRSQTRRGYESGVRTFLWSATDPDGDRLTSRLDVRLEGDTFWFPLAANLTENYFSWDARATPDGHYRVRVTVSDATDNIEGEAIERSETSETFLIDNSRPSLSDWSVERRGREHHVAFTAIDPGGAVAAVEIAVGDGDWQPVRPEDGVADSELERFRLTLSVDGNEDVPSVRVRVTDSAGNLGGEMRRVETP